MCCELIARIDGGPKSGRSRKEAFVLDRDEEFLVSYMNKSSLSCLESIAREIEEIKRQLRILFKTAWLSCRNVRNNSNEYQCDKSHKIEGIIVEHSSFDLDIEVVR